MIISAAKDDPYYSRSANKAQVFLDGQLQRKCLRADDDLGVIIVYAERANGKIEVKDGSAKLLVKRGHVEIAFK
jgi:hypothetical protein